MLKKRIVASIIVKNGLVVQSIGFKKYLPVGSPLIAAEYLNNWGVDEILFLDIDASRKGSKPDFELIREVSKKCFVPLTVGGGIKNLDDIKSLIHCGADKILMNNACLENPALITEAAAIFGSQCIMVSVDVWRGREKSNGVFSYLKQGIVPECAVIEWCLKLQEFGAGEVLLNSVDRDGSKRGFDIDLVNQVSNALTIPLIACGGAGIPAHFEEVLKNTNVSAVAAANFFHFAEHSPILLKSYLVKHGLDVRLDSYSDYRDFSFDRETGRLLKRPEEYLEKLRFEYHPEEVI